MSATRIRGRRTRARAALVLTGAVLVGAAAAPSPSAAQATGDTRLQLVNQKLVLAPEEALTATLAVNGPIPDGAELAVTVSSRLRPARQGLHDLLDDGGELGSTVDFLSVPIAEVPRDTVGRLSLTVPTVRRSSDDRRDALRLSGPGLYPVTFELRTDQDDPVASLLSFVQRTDDTVVAVPMSVSLVTSLSSPPARQPDGSLVVDERTRADLQQLTAALQHNPAAPATLSLPPEVLDRLATSALPEDQAIVQNLAAVLPGRQILSRPYVTMDPSSSARSGLVSDYTRMLAQGEDALQSLFPGITPDRTLFLASGATNAAGAIDDAGLQLLRNLGTLNVILEPPAADTAEDPRASVDPTRTVQVSAGEGSAVRAQVLDRAILQRVAATADPVLAAYYLATELIALQAEAPTEPGRGVVVLPDRPVDSVFLGTLEDLVGQIPQLHAVDLGGLFAATSAATGPDQTEPLKIAPPGGAIADRGDLAAAVAQRRASVGQVASMLPPTDLMQRELREVLDLSLAEDLQPEQRDGYLGTVDGRLGAVTESIVPMDRRQFTITSRSTTIPITIRTTWPEPLRVKVRLTSPKLDFPDGDQIITVTDSSPPFRVPVEAKSNGTFQVTAALLTPEGDAPLGPPMAITVRSTALSGLGILVTTAAGLALAAWWVQHLRAKRRRRRSAAAAERHPTTPIDRDSLPI